ncbi:MAG: SGNH/GDSL hydrolase family protein [Candidatus Pacebacteria bacterium]|nr:SGNH/GDSL hydrolase family protein [Candidatus Paceibacterota bacterium]
MNLISEIENKIKTEEVFKIVFYGASTTTVTYSFPNWAEIMRYTLREKLDEIIGDWKVPAWFIQSFNAGLDGASSRDLLNNLDDFVIKESPDLIFLSISKNDFYYKFKLKETTKNTKKIIDKLLKKGVNIIFTTSVPSSDEKRNEKINIFLENDRKIAIEYENNSNLIFVDFFELIKKKYRSKMYTLIQESNENITDAKKGDIDTIHFNKYGNAVIASVLLKECFGIEFDVDKFIKDIKDDTRKNPRF